MKSKTHIYMANLIAGDLSKYGSLTLPGIGTFTPPADVIDAIKAYPAAFRAGAVGPDFYPDMFLGQTVIHSEDSGKWLNRLFAEYGRLPSNAPERKKCYAYVLGVMMHYAGDMYGHNYVNNWARGWWEYSEEPEKLKIIARHVLVETYMDQLVPKDTAMDLDAPIQFIYDCYFNTSVQPDYKTAPVKTPLDALIDLNQSVTKTNNRNDVGMLEMSNYFPGWIQDIKNASIAWLQSWQSIAHILSDDTHSIREVKDILESWTDRYFLPVIGVPKWMNNAILEVSRLLDVLNPLKPIKEILKKEIFKILSRIIYQITNKQVKDLDEAIDLFKQILEEPAFYLNCGVLYPEYYISSQLYTEMGNYGSSCNTLIQSFHAFYQCLNMCKMCLIGPSNLNQLIKQNSSNSSRTGQVQSIKHSIRLRSYNGQYLCAEGGGGREIVANRSKGDVWETFSVANSNGSALKSGDYITLSTHGNYYVCAEGGGGGEIVANRTQAKEWEHFAIQKVQGSGEIKPGDKVTLRCCNNMFVCAENGGGSTIVGNRTKADIWETFTIEFLNPPVSSTYYSAPEYPRGLRHARVEIETKKNKYFYDTYGTDDNIYFAVILRNGRTYEIRMDKGGYNDFENGRRDSYNMDLPETVYLQDIVEFRLRKDYIKISDDWQPNWIRLYDDANNEIFYHPIKQMIKGRTPYTMAATLPIGSNKVSIDPSIISFIYSLDGKGHDSHNPTSYLPWEPFPFYNNTQLREKIYSKLFEKTCEENLISIRLKAHNQQYVTVLDENHVRVDKGVPGEAETFIISTQKVGSLVSGDAIQLLSYNGHYLCAEGNGGREVVANRDVPASWETFIIQEIGGNSPIKTGDKITLRCSGSQFVCAENGGGDTLVANRSKADVWETFTIEFTETTILPSPKPNEINKLTSWAGFEYDQRQGIFFSTIDCWQRDFGYFPVYDAAAPLAGIFIHSDPICFNYDHKEWKIELWKGQYGICTGAEVGIYVGEFQINTPYRNFNDRINAIMDFRKNTACAPDDFMLQMSFELMKNGKHVFSRDSDNPQTREKDKHWWLTGFKPGVFSHASDLSMRIHIVFPTHGMMKAFWNAIKTLGYPEIHVDEIKFTVDFTFSDPKTPQPWPLLT